MISEMKVLHSIREVAKTDVTAGAQAGRRAFVALVSSTSEPSEPSPVFLDFGGVEAATGSFLRECIFAFRDHCRHALPNAYPVVANAAPVVVEELAFYAKSQAEALWSCALSLQGRISAVQLIGRDNLEAGQQEALRLTETLPEATAPLMAQQSSQAVGVTAWNNRLSALAAKGLVMEQRRGKTKIFRPVLGIS